MADTDNNVVSPAPRKSLLEEHCRRIGADVAKVRAELARQTSSALPPGRPVGPDELAREQRSAELRNLSTAILKLQRQLDELKEAVGLDPFPIFLAWLNDEAKRQRLREVLFELLAEPVAELVAEMRKEGIS